MQPPKTTPDPSLISMRRTALVGNTSASGASADPPEGDGGARVVRCIDIDPAGTGGSGPAGVRAHVNSHVSSSGVGRTRTSSGSLSPSTKSLRPPGS